MSRWLIQVFRSSKDIHSSVITVCNRKAAAGSVTRTGLFLQSIQSLLLHEALHCSLSYQRFSDSVPHYSCLSFTGTVLWKTLKQPLVSLCFTRKWKGGAVIYWNVFNHTLKYIIKGNRVCTTLLSLKVNIWYNHLHSQHCPALSGSCLVMSLVYSPGFSKDIPKLFSGWLNSKLSFNAQVTQRFAEQGI